MGRQYDLVITDEAAEEMEYIRDQEGVSPLSSHPYFCFP
jgi:hypothetical protein